VRERHGAAAALLGFSTYQGTVTAASDWDMPAETKQVRPGLEGSYEALFHGVDSARFRLVLRGNAASARRSRAAPAARDRRHLPAGDRAAKPLLPRSPAAPVRRVIHLDATRALVAARPPARRRRLGRSSRPRPIPRASEARDRCAAGRRTPGECQIGRDRPEATLKQCRP
jgi:hypothetical protein